MKEKLLKKIENKEIEVGVVGLGYVGLPLAVEKAKAGFKTIGFDVQSEKVDLVNNFGMSSSTVAKMSKGESVSMSILIKLCDELECDFGDLIHYER